ncbi:methyltransferase type 11 [Zobellia alginiliquefaciens]|uniref:methyltransferase type 11 n=1 Tax=Zobellia alginiliquefaciens TaxID=3032586 RepID=UPI0023E46C30|nr:methyltransferase type 11 [Zobellia alginiliquefaciens]
MSIKIEGQSTVEIFKTNVSNQRLAKQIVYDLNQIYPDYLINFDLEDCDNVLRIEGNISIDIRGVLNYGKSNNIQIELINY